jgi:hypothetical protein
MKIHKVGELIRFPAGDPLGRGNDGELVFSSDSPMKGEAQGILISLEMVENPRLDAYWCFTAVVDEGTPKESTVQTKPSCTDQCF